MTNIEHQRLEEHVNVDGRGVADGDILVYDSAFKRWFVVPPDQNIDGGKADSVYTPPQLVDGGDA